jgi:hypothetical protein
VNTSSLTLLYTVKKKKTYIKVPYSPYKITGSYSKCREYHITSEVRKSYRTCWYYRWEKLSVKEGSHRWHHVPTMSNDNPYIDSRVSKGSGTHTRGHNDTISLSSHMLHSNHQDSGGERSRSGTYCMQWFVAFYV